MAMNTQAMVERVLATPTTQRNLKLAERYIRAAESVQKAQGKTLNLEKKVALATTLANTKMICEATNSSNIPSKTYFMDMLTAVVPNLIAPDIVSTQALESKAGMISYLRFTYGSDKSPVQAGQMFNNSLYTGRSEATYSSREIVEEPITDGASLDYVPILPGTVTITDSNGTYVDNGNGEFTEVATGQTKTGATINYATGAVSGLGLTDATANYEYNNEQVPDLKVPEINMSLAQIPIFAKSRKLAAYWGFDAAYDLRQQYGTEILDVMSAQAAGEIAHEIDTEIVMKLVQGASAGPEITWSKVAPVGVSVTDHYDSFWVRITEGAKIIFNATQRVQPNFIVCGSNVSAVIECMRNFDGTGATDAVGPHFFGTLGGRYKCYVVPLLDPDVFVLGYKGTNFLETGFVYAPYMPVLSTDILMPADFRGQQGYATSYGTKMLNGKMYLRGRITG
jgi:hypothetical protein